MPVTLLAVDDSVTMRKVLSMTFAGEDYRVVTADSADAALSLARSERPGVIVADTTLEGKTGYDLCQSLKREMPNVPVLLLSSKLHPYDASKGQAAHADDHVDKPFDSQQLIDKVRALVSPQRAAAGGPYRAPTAAAVPQPAPAAAAPQRVPATSPGMYGPPGRPGITATQPMIARGPGAGTPFARPPIGGPITTPSRDQTPSPARTQTRPAGVTTQVGPAPAAATPAAGPPPMPAAAPPAPAPVAAAAAAAPPPQAAMIAAAVDGDMAKKLAGLGLTRDQVDGVMALSHDILERVVWEVVPALAEIMIKEELRRLTAE